MLLLYGTIVPTADERPKKTIKVGRIVAGANKLVAPEILYRDLGWLKDWSASIKENQSTKWPVVSTTLCLQHAYMLLNNFKYNGTYFTDKHNFGIVIL